MKYKRDLLKNTAIITIGRISTQLVSFLLLPLYTSVLSTKEYGSYDLLNTYSIFMIPFITLLMEEAMFRFLIDAKDEKERNSVINQTMTFCLISVFISSILFYIIFKFFHYEYTEYLILFVISSILSTLAGSLCRGMSKFTLYATFNFLSGFLNVILNVIFLVVFKMGLPGLFWSYIIANAVVSLWILIKLKFYKNISLKGINKSLLKQMLFYALPLIPNSLSMIVINLSDRVIVQYVMGASFVGIYAIANKFPNIVHTLYNFFYLAWKESSAKVVKEKNSEEYYNNIYSQLNKFLVAVTILLIAVLPFAFPILVKKQFIDAYEYIPILILAIYFSNISSFYGGIFAAYKNTKIMGISTFVAALLNILINVLFIKEIGLYAAVLSTFISIFIICIYRRIKLKKYVRLEKNKLLPLDVFVCTIVSLIYYSKNYILFGLGLVVALIYSYLINKEMIQSMKNLIVLKVVKKGK